MVHPVKPPVIPQHEVDVVLGSRERHLIYRYGQYPGNRRFHAFVRMFQKECARLRVASGEIPKVGARVAAMIHTIGGRFFWVEYTQRDQSYHAPPNDPRGSNGGEEIKFTVMGDWIDVSSWISQAMMQTQPEYNDHQYIAYEEEFWNMYGSEEVNMRTKQILAAISGAKKMQVTKSVNPILRPSNAPRVGSIPSPKQFMPVEARKGLKSSVSTKFAAPSSLSPMPPLLRAPKSKGTTTSYVEIDGAITEEHEMKKSDKHESRMRYAGQKRPHGDILAYDRLQRIQEKPKKAPKHIFRTLSGYPIRACTLDGEPIVTYNSGEESEFLEEDDFETTDFVDFSTKIKRTQIRLNKKDHLRPLYDFDLDLPDTDDDESVPKYGASHDLDELEALGAVVRKTNKKLNFDGKVPSKIKKSNSSKTRGERNSSRNRRAIPDGTLEERATDEVKLDCQSHAETLSSSNVLETSESQNNQDPTASSGRERKRGESEKIVSNVLDINSKSRVSGHITKSEDSSSESEMYAYKVQENPQPTALERPTNAEPNEKGNCVVLENDEISDVDEFSNERIVDVVHVSEKRNVLELDTRSDSLLDEETEGSSAGRKLVGTSSTTEHAQPVSSIDNLPDLRHTQSVLRTTIENKMKPPIEHFLSTSKTNEDELSTLGRATTEKTTLSAEIANTSGAEAVQYFSKNHKKNEDVYTKSATERNTTIKNQARVDKDSPNNYDGMRDEFPRSPTEATPVPLTGNAIKSQVKDIPDRSKIVSVTKEIDQLKRTEATPNGLAASEWRSKDVIKNSENLPINEVSLVRDDSPTTTQAKINEDMVPSIEKSIENQTEDEKDIPLILAKATADNVELPSTNNVRTGLHEMNDKSLDMNGTIQSSMPESAENALEKKPLATNNLTEYPVGPRKDEATCSTNAPLEETIPLSKMDPTTRTGNSTIKHTSTKQENQSILAKAAEENTSKSDNVASDGIFLQEKEIESRVKDAITSTTKSSRNETTNNRLEMSDKVSEIDIATEEDEESMLVNDAPDVFDTPSTNTITHNIALDSSNQATESQLKPASQTLEHSVGIIEAKPLVQAPSSAMTLPSTTNSGLHSNNQYLNQNNDPMQDKSALISSRIDEAGQQVLNEFPERFVGTMEGKSVLSTEEAHDAGMPLTSEAKKNKLEPERSIVPQSASTSPLQSLKSSSTNCRLELADKSSEYRCDTQENELLESDKDEIEKSTLGYQIEPPTDLFKADILMTQKDATSLTNVKLNKMDLSSLNGPTGTPEGAEQDRKVVNDIPKINDDKNGNESG